jgi:dipeptidyl aminopeptidase/acylaminoacyl peptidase
MKKLLIIMMVTASCFIQAQTGTWEGKLSVQGTEIPLKFNITEDNGTYACTMDSPMQNAFGIPLDKIEVEGKNVTFGLSQAGMLYKGIVKGDTMEGTFSQGGQEFPLVLSKVENKLPGNTALPSNEDVFKELAAKDTSNNTYSVKDYFAKPNSSSFNLSPDGTYMSYREKDANLKNHVYVKDIKTGKVTLVIEEKEELIRGYGWANKDRLLYVMDKGGNEDFHLFSVKIDGTDDKELTPYEGVKVSISAFLKEDPYHVIVSMNKENPQINEPYKLNIETGEIKKLFTNDDPKNPIAGYNFDKDGNLRAYTKLKDGINSQLFYTKDGGKTYDIIKDLNWKEGFGIAKFNYASNNPHEAYVISNLDTDKSVIQLYDLKENKVLKTVFSNDQYDVSGVSLSRKRGFELDYFSYNGEKKEIFPQSTYYKKLHKKITKQFPNYEYGIADYTDDESKYLIIVGSDKLYGKYYTYDVATNAFKLLYDLMPQLKEQDMAEMKPISFKSRDGKTIHGYLTLPANYKKGNKVPVIVNPHGGPQGVRDNWGFNPEAQLFASRGYATLQVNFRISGGYGKEFMESGYGQIGRKCMDDVEDGLQYVINEGYVDKNKVAIYGASHGGYAVLRGMTKTPDLYTCGVDYVGVANLFTFMNSMPAYWKPYLKMIKTFWYDEEDPAQKAIMEEVSPINHIDKIKKPLFVVQGANDPRVNIDESDQIVEALRTKGIDVPYMVKYDEGHGFAKEANRIELYKAMMGFFAKNLK